MKFAKTMILACLTAGMASGCVSIGNRGMDMLSEEEKAELQQEMDEAAREIQTELSDAMAEAAAALDEANTEMYEELGEGAEWIGEMIRGYEERPRKVFWEKAAANGEIEDRDAFADSLALEDWAASDESTEGLKEDTTYTIQWKASIGLLDGRKEEYTDIGAFTVYQDSNLVTARIYITDGIMGKAADILGASIMGKDFTGWLTIVYEVPEDVAEALRR